MIRAAAITGSARKGRPPDYSQTIKGVRAATTTDELVVTSPASRTRRRVWEIAAGITVVLLAAFTGGFLYLERYQPLSLSGGRVEGPDVERVHTMSWGTEHVVSFRQPGSELRVEYFIQNEGPLAVTLLSAGDRRGGFPKLQWVGVTTDSTRMMEPFQRLDEFVVPGGASAWIRLDYRFPSCEPGSEANGEVWKAFAVKFRVLGVSRNVLLDLPFGVAVKGSTCRP